MKPFFLLILCGIALTPIQAQDAANFWRDVPSSQIVLPRGAEMELPTNRYRTLELDFSRMSILLRRAPMEFSGRSGLKLQLPLPDGSMEIFEIEESPVMEAGLAAKYPEIRTYTARGLKHPELSARLDVSPAGFHGAIRTPEGLAYIDPYASLPTAYYVSYYTKDLQIDPAQLPACGTDDAGSGLHLPELDNIQAAKTTQLRGGDAANVELRRYRLAVACTGEYGIAKGGNKPAVLGTIVTAINRVNQIFEAEVAVRLQLIANNDTLIYLDSANDPYPAADDARTLLTQNTAVINQVIGAQSYDIGHVFTLGCKSGVGGIARYSSVCASEKGGGVTCHFSNSVEFIAVQIMAHEIGHQFSCAHSWNSCPGIDPSQYEPSEAFEPGSGSTIMSYANACGSDNIQLSSDDYYHVGSLEDFIAYSRDNVGNICATVIPTTNRPPQVSHNYPKSFAIPLNTPFELKAAGSDPDGDALTYCWEQYDLGPTLPLGEARLNSPLFRSFRPTAAANRIFPRIASIANNERPKTELLPTYARKMTFRCTVRDNKTAGGGVAWTQVQFDVTDKAGPFLVTAPDTAATNWQAGSTQEVKWNVANTDVAPVNCRYVNIRLSIDGGMTYPYLLAENAPNNGMTKVTVPSIVTASARIKVEAADNIFFDISNRNFSILSSTKPGYAITVNPYVIPLNCQPAPVEFQVATTQLMSFNSQIKLELVSPLPGASTFQFSPNPVKPGETSKLSITLKDVPEDTVTLIVRATATGGDTILRELTFSTLSNDFSALKMTSPVDGTSGIVLSTPFTWNGVANALSYDLEVATNPRFDNSTVAKGSGITAKTFQPATLLDNNRLYYWRIRPVNECGPGNFLTPFTFHTATVACDTFSSTNVPINIPGAGTPTIESRITVNKDGTINDVNIPLVRINKEYVRNLRVSLVSPKGTEVVVYNGQCALTSRLLIGFDDDAPTAVNGSGVCPPDDGIVFRPIESLSAFKGENIRGNWILRVRMLRNESLSPGALESWRLEFCSAQAASNPTLVKRDTLRVPPGKVNTITTKELLAEDNQVQTNQLTYTLVQKPAFGVLRAYGQALNVGDQFSQATINSFDLRYTHNGGTDINDAFIFVVQNGKGGFISPKTLPIKMDAGAVVGIEELSGTYGVRVFPNPASHQVQVTFEKALESASRLQLFNLQGQSLLSSNLPAGTRQTELSVQQLPAGLYLLKIDLDKGQISQKLQVGY